LRHKIGGAAEVWISQISDGVRRALQNTRRCPQAERQPVRRIKLPPSVR
jgi:hypothetical protein